MKKITRLWQLMLVALLISSVGFAQSYSVADVRKEKKELIYSKKKMEELYSKGMISEKEFEKGVLSKEAQDKLNSLTPKTTSSEIVSASQYKAPGAVLYSQMTPSVNIGGEASQDFEAAFDAYDCIAADDFTVTGGDWNLTKISFYGSYTTGPADGFNIEFYADNSGMPGASVAAYSNLYYVNDGTGLFWVWLPAPLTLTDGTTYWVSIQARMDFTPGGQFYWSEHDETSVVGNDAVWQNPGDGFATGYTTWTAVSTVNPGPPASHNFTFELSDDPVPSCIEVNNLATSGITSSSADLSWSADPSETAWEVEYGSVGFVQGTGTIVNVTPNPTTTLSGLTLDTEYDWYVRASCGGGNYSVWRGPVTFSTLCGTLMAPYSEDFTGASFPACWSQTSDLGAEKWSVSNTTNAGGTANEMKNSWQSGTGITRLISPELDLTGLTIPTLTFNHFFNDYGAGITAKIQTSIDGGNTWVDESWSIASGGGNIGPETIEITLTNTGANTLVAWVMDGNHYQFDYWYIDDVSIDEAPACPAPTSPTTTDITTSGAKLNWTSTSSLFEYEYGAIGFVPGTGNEIGSGGTHNLFVTISGLSSGTTYDWYVRADCGGGSYSSWVGSSFTTVCGVVTPDYTEDFSSFLPNCWDEADDGDATTGPTSIGASPWRSSSALGTGSAAINLYSASHSDWLLSPEFDLSAGGYQVVVDVAVTNWYSSTPDIMGSDDAVQLLYTEDGTTWNVITTWTEADNLANTPTTFTFPLTSSGADVVFGILATDGPTNDDEDYDFHIDKFVIETIPTCPAPTGLGVASVTSTAANLVWTSNSGLSNIEYGLEGFTLGTDPIGTGSGVTSPFPVSGLSVGTVYEFYVQDDCGGGDLSAWAGPYSFAPTPTNDDCANAVSVVGPYPVSGIPGTTIGATVDCPGVLNWDAVWYAIDLPYATNQITINLCLDDAGATLNNTGIILAPQCGVCDNFIHTDGSWSVSGNCISNMVFEVEGPATVYYPVMTDPKGSFTFDVDVVQIPTIIGTLMYANGASTELDHSVVTLTDAVPTDYDYNTECDGLFRFAGYPAGNYELTGSTTKVWGGLTMSDVLLGRQHFLGSTTLTGINLLAADVTWDSPNAVDMNDVLLMRQKFLDVTVPFNAPDYVFETHSLTLAGGDIVQNVQALCAGDPDGSYTPPPTCAMPTNLGSTEISPTEYDLTWDGTGSSDLEWGPVGFTPGDGTGTLVAGATSPYNLSGLTAGNSYDFYVRDYCCGGSTPSDWAGPFTFPPPPPANDDCANAEIIGEVSDYPFNTTYATASGLDTHSMGADVWFSYTPAANGTIDVDLCGSAYDTKLAIYDGTCGALNELGYNDDDNAFCGGGDNSRVTGINVVAGTTYLIQVGGFNGHVGEGDITILFY